MQTVQQVHDIRRITADDLSWQFQSDGMPSFRCGTWGHQAYLDPFPGYPHDLGLVEDCAERLAEVWPAQGPLTYWLSDFEERDRSRAHASRSDLEHEDGVEIDWHAHIFLSAKRTPIHPGDTRQLCGHEYGHHAMYWMQRERGVTRDQLLAEYAAVRGLAPAGKRWHTWPVEVFASDFRVLVADLEPAFWPHQGIVHPHGCVPIRDWWERATESHGHRPSATHVARI